jgi:hypothetical protein
MRQGRPSRAPADRRGDGGARGRQLAHILRVQGDLVVGLDGAGDSFGLARQGVCLSTGNRSAANYFRIAIGDDERTRREKVKGRNASEIGVGRTSWMRGNSENRTTSRVTIHRKSL